MSIELADTVAGITVPDTALTAAMKHRHRTTYATMNADVLAHFDPSFVRDDFVASILDSSWPE